MTQPRISPTDYAAKGLTRPKYDSDEALHADHVYEMKAEALDVTKTVAAWAELLQRARTVVEVRPLELSAGKA